MKWLSGLRLRISRLLQCTVVRTDIGIAFVFHTKTTWNRPKLDESKALIQAACIGI